MKNGRASGGNKRSSWLTIRRCLVLMRRLMRGPATAAQLIEEAQTVFGGKAYAKSADVALRQDISRLRNDFKCTIRFTRNNGYVLLEAGELAPLDLPDQHAETLARLAFMARSNGLEHSTAIAELTGFLLGLLPGERREMVVQQSYLLQNGHNTAKQNNEGQARQHGA